MSKAITHSRWIRGLQAGFDRFSLPKGAVSRISNMVYTRRGALKNCDGSLIFSAFGGLNPFSWNPLTSKFWREVFYYAPSSSIRTGYFGLYSDPATPLATSLGTPTLATNGTGLTGTYFIKMTAVDGVGGESAASPEANIVVANQGIKITWTPVANAYGYNVYVATSSGAEVLWLPPGDLAAAVGVSVIGSATSTIIIDNTWISNANQVPSTVDTSSQLIFTSIPIGGYSSANAVKTLPAAISAISTGSSASIDTTSAPVTTTTQFLPTATAAGGPVAGTHPFTSATAGGTGLGESFTDESGHTDGGEQQSWSGFSADSGTITAVTLSVNSSMSLSFGSHGIGTIRYSLNNGSSWYILALRSVAYSATDSASLPLTQDLTQVKVSAFVEGGATANSSATMHVLSIAINVTTLVASGGTSGSGGLGTGGGTPNGGVSGICGPLPMIVGFVGKMILALGNGITPYQSDGTTAGTTQLTNTFTAVYPARIASSLYNKGDQIEATVAGTAYVFTAQQEGTTGSGGPPAFAATLGSTVTDGQVVWKNTGQVTTSPAPRGAAHEEIYAGSLWVANTSPTLTTDQLDGPSALRMSDLNNPISWNPLNAAEISPDDGDECTGIKAFTVAEAGIAPQNFLMFFKNFSSYLIQGVFGSTNFSITRLQTDIGNVAARSIQFLPGYGIMRLSHLGFAVTDGISDKLQDPEAIRPLLFAETTEDDITPIDWSTAWFSKAAQTVEPPMYVCAMPLVGANANLIALLTGVTVTVTSSGSPMLPTGNYYVQVGLRGPNGVTSLSAISGPFAIVSGTSFLSVGNAALPAGYYGFRVWFGNSPTTLNQYVDGDSTTITIQAPGSGGIPPTSIAGALTRVFCYDLIIKAWTVFDLPFSISVLRQSRIEGSIPLTIAAGRSDDSIRQMQAGDQTWDAGATNPVIQWSFKDGEVYDEGASVILYHNQVIIRGDDAPSSVNVTTEINGQVQAIIQASLTALGVDQYEARARIFQRAENLALTISGSGPATVESVTYEVGAKKPIGSSLVIA
jgi:hypothetical protein